MCTKHEPSATSWTLTGEFHRQRQHLDHTPPLRSGTRFSTTHSLRQPQRTPQWPSRTTIIIVSSPRANRPSSRTHTLSNNVTTSALRPRPHRAKPSNTETAGEARIEQILRGLQTQQTPTLGLMEHRGLRVHPLQRHPPRHGHAHLARQERRPRLLDRRADAVDAALGQRAREQVLGA